MDEGDDPLRLVQDILDADATLLDYVKERASQGKLHPEAVITAACSDLMSDLDDVESAISLCDSTRSGAVALRARRKQSFASTTARFDAMLTSLSRDATSSAWQSDRASYSKLHTPRATNNPACEQQRRMDTETEAILASTRNKLAIERQEVLARVRQDLQERRQRELNVILLENERRVELETQSLTEKFAIESKLRRAALLVQLDEEKARAFKDIEDAFLKEEAKVEEEARAALAREIQDRREAAATKLLLAHEAELSRLRTETLRQHESETEQEMAKLKAALSMGSTLRLDQLTQQLARQLQAKLEAVETSATTALDAEMEKRAANHEAEVTTKVHALQQELRATHRDEMARLEQRLVVAESRALNDVTMTMHAAHVAQMDAVEARHRVEVENRRRELQVAYEKEFAARLAATTESLEWELTQQLEAQARDQKAALAAALDETTARFGRRLERLRRELRIVVPTVPPSTPLHTLQTLADVVAWVDTVGADVADVAGQHAGLLDTIERLSKQVLAAKRNEPKTAQLQAEVNRVLAELDDKSRVCQQLYMANDGLLRRLRALEADKDGPQ
ncbi:hypothetical protein ACHHYP_11898 [Achlya hypogyna]|uniref:Uncharacterized protein n=1 Tax=Achlya hypogyna TaxID=1202772 RepID=A0A1V9YI18_ACHHY|nr:hypothetical protein ACHHYP_11898 [Achlya hypogyna]